MRVAPTGAQAARLRQRKFERLRGLTIPEDALPENQGFNVAKTWYGLAHVPHHHVNSLLMHWLLVIFALTIERLYRLRYLRRGTHPPLTAMAFVRRLWLSLGAPRAPDTS